LAFTVMDLDKDGFISFEDLKLFLESIGEQRTDE
jgi:Ca2+-binding EF-hand superfamily protein